MSWNIIGHEWAVSLLQRSVANDNLAHAYLFTGIAGIGKALLALRLAQVLNCDVGGPAPCLTCRTCKRIARGNHPDVRIAGMETQGRNLKAEEAARQKELKIDTVREWQQDITLRPFEGRRRVFILHDAERLNDAAANAMLKTLEEPPPHATLILVANTTGDLLPTIVSRCQPLKLRPVARAVIAAALQARHELPAEEAKRLAAWSGGRVGWALQMATAPEELTARLEQLDELVALAGQPRSVTFRWVEERAKEFRAGEQATVYGLLELWQGWWRDVLLMAADCGDHVMYIDRRDELRAAAKRYSVAEVSGIVRRLEQAAKQLRENVNPQLALEHVVLHLPRG